MKLLYSDYTDTEHLRELSEKYKVPGFNFTLIKNGVATETQAYGITNSETMAPMTPSTIFEAASLTKTLFATLIMRLRDWGMIDLDQPISPLAPDIKVSHDPRIDKVTARQILSHGSGLPDWGHKPDLEFKFDPGKGFSYSGEGYYYLQKVADEVTGKEFCDQYCDEFIRPLGMFDSAPIWSPKVGAKESRKFSADGEMLEFRDYIDLSGDAPEPNAAWSLYSGARDYGKYMLEILNEHGHLSPESFGEMVKPQNQATASILWGLGWGIPEKDQNVIWHWGDNGGYRSLAAMDIKTKDGACIFCNSYGGIDLSIDFLDSITDSSFWSDVAEFIEGAEE